MSSSVNFSDLWLLYCIDRSMRHVIINRNQLYDIVNVIEFIIHRVFSRDENFLTGIQPRSVTKVYPF